MKLRWKLLIPCLAIPLLVGGAAALLTQDGMEAFMQLTQPPLSPPKWLFPIAWTILYLLMGTASYLVLTSQGSQRRITRATTVYAVQLAFNFFWTILFFGLGAHLLAFLWLVVLWILIWVNTIQFYHLRPAAGWLMVPYLLWVAFAGYLNLGIWLLN